MAAAKKLPISVSDIDSHSSDRRPRTSYIEVVHTVLLMAINDSQMNRTVCSHRAHINQTPIHACAPTFPQKLSTPNFSVHSVFVVVFDLFTFARIALVVFFNLKARRSAFC